MESRCRVRQLACSNDFLNQPGTGAPFRGSADNLAPIILGCRSDHLTLTNLHSHWAHGAAAGDSPIGARRVHLSRSLLDVPHRRLDEVLPSERRLLSWEASDPRSRGFLRFRWSGRGASGRSTFITVISSTAAARRPGFSRPALLLRNGELISPSSAASSSLLRGPKPIFRRS